MESGPPCRMTNTSRRSNITDESASGTSRLEKKRAADREAQRANRARTRAYIAHLEKTTQALVETPEKGDATLLRLLTEQYEEIERMKNVISNIGKLAGSITEASTASAGFEMNNKGIDHQAPLLNTRTESSSIADSELRNRDASNDWNQPRYTSQDSLHTLYPALDMNCGNGNRDYFGTLNHALLMIERFGTLHRFTGLDVDNDTNIRAVLHGWEAAKSSHNLDIGWQLLQSIDQGLFFRAGSVERIAILRIIRSMLLLKVYPDLPAERRPPAYMNSTTLQTQIEHPRIIDYFAWPFVRDYLVLNRVNFAPETLAAQFATDIGLKWRFDLRDVCKYDISKGKYTFSKEFDEVYNDMASWYLKSSLTWKLFNTVQNNKQDMRSIAQIGNESCHLPSQSHQRALNSDANPISQVYGEENFALDIPELDQLSTLHANNTSVVQEVGFPELSIDDLLDLTEGISHSGWPDPSLEPALSSKPLDII